MKWGAAALLLSHPALSSSTFPLPPGKQLSSKVEKCGVLAGAGAYCMHHASMAGDVEEKGQSYEM